MSGRGRFALADPLRAVAALAVLLYHVSFTALLLTLGDEGTGRFEEVYGSFAGALLGNLDLGLYLFFVLSGYLLSRPFIASLTTDGSVPDVRRYVRNRLLRIVPAFWVVFLATLAYYGPRGSDLIDILAIPAFLQSYRPSGLAQVIGQAWTLDVEIAFYLLLPVAALVLARATGRPLRLQALVAVIVLTGAASLAVRSAMPLDERYLRSLPAMLFAFVPGMLLAAVEPVVLASERLKRLALLVVPAAIAGSAVCAVVYLGLDRDAPAERGLLAAGVAGGLVAAPLLWQWAGRRPWRVLDARPAHWLGARSYGIYLVHNGFLIALMPSLAEGRGPRALFAIALLPVLAGTLVLADLLHRFVERPALARRAPAPSSPP